jgi:hypothetical protein
MWLAKNSVRAVGKRRTGPEPGPSARPRFDRTYLTVRDFTARDFTARDFTARDFVTRVAALFPELVEAFADGFFGVTFFAGIPFTSSLTTEQEGSCSGIIAQPRGCVGAARHPARVPLVTGSIVTPDTKRA